MANELTLSGLTIAFSKSNCPPVNFSPTSISPTVAGTQWMDNVQLIGTSEEAILLGDVAAGGYCFFQNMDATNFVTIRAASGAADLVKLLAGEWCVFRMAASAPFAIADTGSCNLRCLRFDL